MTDGFPEPNEDGRYNEADLMAYRYDWTPRPAWNAIQAFNNPIGDEMTPEQAQQLATILANQKQILANQKTILDVVRDNQVQLRGPGLTGWPQLGDEPAGHRTLVDAFAATMRFLKVL